MQPINIPMDKVTAAVTPVIDFVRQFIDKMPFGQVMNYIIVSFIAGYLFARASYYMEPWKIGLLGGALVLITLLFV